MSHPKELESMVLSSLACLDTRLMASSLVRPNAVVVANAITSTGLSPWVIAWAGTS